MQSDRFIRISRARKTFTDLYDQLADQIQHPETWNDYADALNLAANEVWTLLAGARDMPPFIEMCLPCGHEHFVDPSMYLNKEK